MNKFLGILVLGLLWCNTSFADLTFVSWGGAYTASQQKAYIDTWSKGSRVTVENYNGGLEKIRAQVNSGNIQWDVVDILPDQAINGCEEGLFEKIPQDQNMINDMFGLEIDFEKVIAVIQEWKTQIIGFATSSQLMIMQYKQTVQKMKDTGNESFYDAFNKELEKAGI